MDIRHYFPISCVAATRRFFEMARSKAQRIAKATGKLYNAAISQKRPSLWVAFWRVSASLSRVANSPCYLSTRLALRAISPEQQRSYATNRKTVPVWLLAVCALVSSANAAEDTAQRKEPIIEDRPTVRFLERLNLTDKEVGVYYVPPVDADTRGFIFDDIPRETITTQAHLTERRIKKEGSFVRFNHRHISYSLVETHDNSFRANLYPTKKAFMLNWTHAIPVLAD